MKRFSAKLSEAVLLDLRAQRKASNLGAQVNKCCLFLTSAYIKWTPNGSRVLFAEFETKFFLFSAQNSTTGEGMALDKQVKQKCETWPITLLKSWPIEFEFEFVI